MAKEFLVPIIVPAGSVSSAAIQGVGDPNTGVYFPAADALALTTGGVKGLEQDSSQRILVGGATATAQMNVQSATAARIALIVKMAASQSADAFAVQTSGGGNRFQVSPVGNLAAMGAPTSALVGLNLGTGGERLDTTGNPYLIQGTVINQLSGNVNGALITAETRYAGAISSMQVFQANVSVNNAASVVSSARGFFAPSPTIMAGAAITTMTGLRIEAQKITGVTTGFAIQSLGATDQSVIAGTLFVGSSGTIHGSAKLEVDGCIKIKVWTVGTLPTGVSGLESMVSDALTPVFGNAVAAGGSVVIPVYAEGTTWKVG